MKYPDDFPTESRAKVEVAIIRAGRKFDSAIRSATRGTEAEAHFWSYVLTPFLVFAEESYRLRLWPVDTMDKRCREFLRLLTINATSKGRGIVGDPIDNWDGSIRLRVQQEIEEKPQWRKYENIRLKLAEGSSQREESKAAKQVRPSRDSAAGKLREEILRPLLVSLSVHDWANKAKVDFHTADNYLKGKTNPYPSTRKKLADGLGIEIEKLPP